MSVLRPLFRFDPGWLFTIAGLALLVVSALLPAQQDLASLNEQLMKLEHQELMNQKRIEAYRQFLVELKVKDSSLLTRLAASQLNLMPEGAAPVLMATSMEHTVSDWIEATVTPQAFEPNLIPDTLLTRLASGQRRLWLMGGGALIVFIGLTTGIPLTPSTRLVATALEKQWLEQAQMRADFPSDAREEIAHTLDVSDPPDARMFLDEDFDLPAEMPIEMESATKAHIAGEVSGEVVGNSTAVVAKESVATVDEEMADGKWIWDAEANVEPYILISQAESGNSAAGDFGLKFGGASEEFWPHAAD
ncbi:MAG: hypothetical protein EXS12_03190 [Phycisphaerales bacterium]|nr:hypothetical protein [Phycisphaerales bacterium]